MKKTITALIFCIFVLSSASFAQTSTTIIGVGSRYVGMGGCGIALSDDICAAYYNPAGLMRSHVKAGEFKLSLGAAYDGLDKVLSSASSTDPAKFLVDNYGNEVKVNGTLNGILGVNINKIGISILPIGQGLVDKPINSYNGTFSAGLAYAAVLTLGKSFSVPWLPFASIQGGANIKLISENGGVLTTTGVTPTGTEQNISGSGFGLDLGAQTEIAIPSVTEVTVGVVARNLFQSVNLTNKSTPISINPISGAITRGATTQSSSTYTYPTVYGIGAAAILPGIGTLITSDLEFISGPGSTNIMRVGAEHPLIPYFLTVRGGLASGNNTSYTTLGVTLNLLVNLNAAVALDGTNSKNNSVAIDIGAAF